MPHRTILCSSKQHVNGTCQDITQQNWTVSVWCWSMLNFRANSYCSDDSFFVCLVTHEGTYWFSLEHCSQRSLLNGIHHYCSTSSIKNSYCSICGHEFNMDLCGCPHHQPTPLLQQLVMGLLMSFISVITTRKSITIPAEVHESLKIVHTTKDYHHYTSYLHGVKHGSWQKCVSLCGSTLLYDS